MPNSRLRAPHGVRAIDPLSSGTSTTMISRTVAWALTSNTTRADRVRAGFAAVVVMATVSAHTQTPVPGAVSGPWSKYKDPPSSSPFSVLFGPFFSIHFRLFLPLTFLSFPSTLPRRLTLPHPFSASHLPRSTSRLLSVVAGQIIFPKLEQKKPPRQVLTIEPVQNEVPFHPRRPRRPDGPRRASRQHP